MDNPKKQMISGLIYVVILNYNHKDDLLETIGSFVKQDYNSIKIIVVDNGSTDDSIICLKRSFPDIEVILNGENLGWAAGNNIGVKHALSNKSDYILLANNDLFFEESIIVSSLVTSLLKYPDLKVIGPRQNFYSDRSKNYNSGWNFFPESGKIYNSFRKNSPEKNSNISMVDNVSGSFMLIKCDVFNEVGMIDENFFLYAEDTDFCLRIWENGYKCGIDNDLTIYHKVSSTAGINSPLKRYYKSRNLFYLIRKHKDAIIEIEAFKIKLLRSSVLLFLKILFRKEYMHKRLSLIKAHSLGIWHGFVLKRMGKYY